MPLIDPKIQSDFNSFVLSNGQDPASFTAAKDKLLADISEAAVNTTDPDTKNGFQALAAVIGAWTFPGQEAEATTAQVPSEQTVNRFRGLAQYFTLDLTEIMSSMANVNLLERRFDQALSITAQQQGMQTALMKKANDDSAAQKNYNAEINSAAGQLGGAALGFAGAAAGLGGAVRAGSRRSGSAALREGVRDGEETIETSKNALAANKATQQSAKEQLADTQADPATYQMSTDEARDVLSEARREGAKLRDEIAQQRSALQANKDKLSDADVETEQLLKVSQGLSGLGQALSGFGSSAGNIAAAAPRMDAAKDAANSQLEQAMMEVMSKMGSSFDDFALQNRQAADKMNDTMSQMLRSQSDMNARISANA